MDRFRNILLLHDESPGFETALDRTIALARRDGAYLTIAEAVPHSGRGPLSALNPFSPSPSDDEAERIRRENGLARAVGLAQQAGVAARSVTLEGPPHSEILRHVVNRRHDLVVAADVPRGPFRRIFGRPLAARLTRLCPCPVWVVKPHEDRRLRRVVAALAAGDAVGVPEEVDHSVLAFAARLARSEGCKLDIVHAWDFKGRDLETSRSELIPPMHRALYRRTHLAHAKALHDTLSPIDLDGVDYEIHLPKGDPFTVLLDFSDKHAVDLIVAGTISRTGLDRLAFGDMVERLLPLVTCSVVAIKPADFVAALEPAATRSRPVRRPVAVRYRTEMTSGTFSERIR